MKVRFWGTRGSIPTPGSATVRYGGNTLCVEVTNARGDTVILDGGTGLFGLGQHLLREQQALSNSHATTREMTVLLSHAHWDHVQGLPFFLPGYYPHSHVTLFGPHGLKYSMGQLVDRILAYSSLELGPERLQDNISCVEADEGEITGIPGFRVFGIYLNHTVLCLGYRLEADGSVLTYFTDVEACAGCLTRLDGPGLASLRAGKSTLSEVVLHREDMRVVEMALDTDLHIQDAMYDSQQYPNKIGWGHSTVEFATEVALAAGAKKLALYHHDPIHNDDFVDALVEESKRIVSTYENPPQVFGASEGLVIAI